MKGSLIIVGTIKKRPIIGKYTALTASPKKVNKNASAILRTVNSFKSPHAYLKK